VGILRCTDQKNGLLLR